MSDARSGWGGELWLSTDDTVGNLQELVEVVTFGLPDDTIDEIDVTHLKSPGKRKEFISGLVDGGTVEAELNYVPNSLTDQRIRAARDGRDIRAVRFVIPDEVGTPDWQIDTFAFVSAYGRGPVTADGKISSTVRFRITGDATENEYGS